MSGLADRLTHKVSGSYPLGQSYHLDHLSAELPDMVAQAVDLVAEETGLPMSGHPDVQVVSRPVWVERNLHATLGMIRPALVASDPDTSEPQVRGARKLTANGWVGSQLRLFLAMLSRWVLGQYELVLPDESESDSMAFVGENLLAVERSQMFRPAEFRMWVALHECAHRAQFEGVPWLRPYFMDQIGQLIRTVTQHSDKEETEVSDTESEEVTVVATPKTVKATDTADKPQQGESMKGWWGWWASPAQREQIDRIQALMSLLEGHGHVVMDRVGERILHTSAQMSARLKQRRSKAGSSLLFRLTGLEMKIAQYEQGERFILEVERQAGWEVLDRVWQGPEQLPDLVEIKQPDRWLARVG